MPFVTQVVSSRSSVIARSSGGKINIKKQGLNTVKNDVVRKNLMGVSDTMKKGDWVDSSGRKGALFYCFCCIVPATRACLQSQWSNVLSCCVLVALVEVWARGSLTATPV